MDSNNKTLIKNSMLLYLRMFVVMGVGLYSSRLILDALGVVDYGIYNVVGSAVSMLIFLNVAMTTSTERFLSVELGKEDNDKLSRAFSVSLVIHFFIGIIVILLCETIGLWFLYNKMVIAECRMTSAFWTFQFSLVTAFLSIISVPYNALIISHENMNAFAYISVLDVLLKLCVCFILYTFGGDRLILYATLIATIQLFDRFIYWWYCKRHFKEANFHFYRHDSLYKEMLAFASWALLAQFAYVCNTSGQNLMLNTFFSPVINAARGISVQVSNAIQQFSSNFQKALEPQILKSYAAGDKERTYDLINNGSRFSLYLLFLISLPIILKMDAILAIWLVKVPKYTAIFIDLSLIDGIIVSLNSPLNMAINSHGKLKMPGIIFGIMYIIILPTSYLFLRLGYSPSIIFVIQLFMDCIIQTVRLVIAKYYCGISIVKYLQQVVLQPLSVISFSLILPLFWIYTKGSLDNIESIISTSVISILSVTVAIFFIGLNVVERAYVINYIKNKF